jgi:hypothetical protein
VFSQPIKGKSNHFGQFLSQEKSLKKRSETFSGLYLGFAEM